MLNHIIYSIISITYNAQQKQVHRTCFCYLCAGDGDLPFRKRSGGSFSGKSGEAMLSPDRRLALQGGDLEPMGSRGSGLQ